MYASATQLVNEFNQQCRNEARKKTQIHSAHLREMRLWNCTLAQSASSECTKCCSEFTTIAVNTESAAPADDSAITSWTISSSHIVISTYWWNDIIKKNREPQRPGVNNENQKSSSNSSSLEASTMPHCLTVWTIHARLFLFSPLRCLIVSRKFKTKYVFLMHSIRLPSEW